MILKKFSDFVIKYKYIVLAIFSVLLILGILGTIFLVNDPNKINSDMVSYLSNDFDTKKGLIFLDEYFGIKGDALIVVRGTDDDADLRESVNKIKSEHKEEIRRFIWVEDIESITEIEKQLASIDKEKLKFLEEENVQQMLKDKSLSSILPMFKYLADLPPALDMTVDISEFATFLKRDIGDGYYDYVMMVMTDLPTSSREAHQLLDNITEKLTQTKTNLNGVSQDREIAIAGMTQNSKTTTEETLGDIPNFLTYAIIAVIIILLLTSASFIEPIILIVTLGVSIVISMGINYLYPFINIFSYSTSAILQLAITMDYAIFYMHTYRRKRLSLNAKDASISAIPEVAPSVLASGLTTIGGFVALYFMRFKVGADISNVIIKGIILSILSVVALQPILTLLLDKVITKTTHNFTGAINKKIKEKSKKEKSFELSNSLLVKPIARFSVWQRITLVIIAVALIVPSFILQNRLSYSYLSLYDNKASTPEQIFAQELGNQTIIAVPLAPKQGYTHQDFIEMVKSAPYDKVSGVVGAFTTIKNIEPKAMTAFLEILSDEKNIKDVQAIIDTLADPTSQNYAMIEKIMQNYDISLEELDLEQYNLHEIDLEDMLKDFDPSLLNSYFAKVDTKWYTLYSVSIKGSAEDAQAEACYKYLKGVMEECFGKNSTYSIGMLTASYDLIKTTMRDFLIVTLVSAGIIFLIVSVLLKNPIKSLILVVLIELGIWINFSITHLMGQQINFMVYIIISGIQLGCTVDYAILLANTFENNRDKYKTGKKCAINSAMEAVPAIFTSVSVIITVCMVVFFVSKNSVIKQLTALLARGSLISFISVTFLQTAIMSFYKTERKVVDYESKLKELEEALDDKTAKK
ncbi:MAG: MMPL family transporter [Clostridiales bacterium]|nr:MMPL family transporter [Clostridiales bacterium]